MIQELPVELCKDVYDRLAPLDRKALLEVSQSISRSLYQTMTRCNCHYLQAQAVLDRRNTSFSSLVNIGLLFSPEELTTTLGSWHFAVFRTLQRMAILMVVDVDAATQLLASQGRVIPSAPTIYNVTSILFKLRNQHEVDNAKTIAESCCGAEVITFRTLTPRPVQLHALTLRNALQLEMGLVYLDILTAPCLQMLQVRSLPPAAHFPHLRELCIACLDQDLHLSILPESLMFLTLCGKLRRGHHQGQPKAMGSVVTSRHANLKRLEMRQVSVTCTDPEIPFVELSSLHKICLDMCDLKNIPVAAVLHACWAHGTLESLDLRTVASDDDELLVYEEFAEETGATAFFEGYLVEILI